MSIASQVESLLDALISHLRQNDRLLRLTTVADAGGAEAAAGSLLAGALPGQSFVPEAVSIDEHLSRGGFTIELTAVSLDAHADLDALIGTPVLLELLTAASTTALRPFHAHIASARSIGANGGLARYQFTLQPWLGALALRRDSHLWVEKTVVEIIEDLFADYEGQGRLVPAWRWALADAAAYPKRSLTVQYEETDLAFLERLLAEEGMAYHFEHAADPTSPALGSHTLVIADHNDAYPPGAQPVIRYHRAHATEADDTIQQFQPQAAWKPDTVALASWDYKSLSTRAVAAVQAPAQTQAQGAGNAARHLASLRLSGTKGHYGYPDSAHGERYARQALEALQLQAKTIHGEGAARTLAPGSGFVLAGHARYDSAVAALANAAGIGNAVRAVQATGLGVGGGADGSAGADDRNRFLLLTVHHEARNNFRSDLGRGLAELLGASPLLGKAVSKAGVVGNGVLRTLLPMSLPSEAGSAGTSRNALQSSTAKRGTTPDAATADDDAQPLYRNYFTCLTAATPLRLPTRPDLKPSVRGAQTALVVGAAGAPIHTDRDHRVRVQFHWQRGIASSSRLPHPAADGGHDNAPADASQSVWLRVRTDVAGANWGQVALPRVGQEVLVHCLDGDPDRPVVTGAIYNGQGQPDAQGNRYASGAAGATGNAVPWFAGEEGFHAHPASLSGLHSMSLDASQTGGAGHNAVVFDATPGEGRITAASSQHATSLTLGHLKAQQGNARKSDRGYGFELKTAASGLVKGGQGLLLTSEVASIGQPQLQATGLVATLEQASAFTTALADTAAKQLPAKTGSKDGSRSATGSRDNDLPAAKAQTALLTSLAGTATGQASAVAQGGEGTVPAWTAPHLVAHGHAGLVALTPTNLHQAAGQTFSQIAGQDLNRLAQGSQTLTAKAGITLFTHGQAAKDADGKTSARIVTGTGMRLHAATGPVSVQAQSATLSFNAQKGVAISSTHAGVNATAKGRLLLTAKGAAVTIEGGNITLIAPGPIKLQAGQKVLTTPISAEAQKLAFKQIELKLKRKRTLNFSG